MDIQLTGRHIEITDGIRQHVIDKLSKLERYDERLGHPMVVLSVEKGVHFAEAKLHIMGHEIFAKSETHDLYQAIDEMADKLDTQIHKLKSKLQNHHHKNNHDSRNDENDDIEA
ncbi:MAG: sigma 54 modulation protein / ribosomal protein [Gammaproteobacteria bacterium]|jgi:putative sigma-54 modulation protein|nr:sigma 54 modulation protein / ribosomal protein [Gammaproteobacteria bacterium]